MTEPTLYVLVWREPNSRRLRTYTSANGKPLASPMTNIFPKPPTTISTSEDLNAWLNSPADQDTVAVEASLTQSELGWEPESPAAEETTDA